MSMVIRSRARLPIEATIHVNVGISSMGVDDARTSAMIQVLRHQIQNHLMCEMKLLERQIEQKITAALKNSTTQLEVDLAHTFEIVAQVAQVNVNGD